MVLFLFGCSPKSKKNNNVEGSISVIKNDTVIEEEKIGKMFMTTSSNLEPSKDIKLYDCDFTIVLNDSGDTTHWSTNDNNFNTPEGFKVGTNWNKLPIELRNLVEKMPGWGYYIRLNSGWQLGFCEGPSCTDMEPKEGSLIKWIFKRKD